jgi:2-dehydro-3-deoxygalactonokinase
MYSKDSFLSIDWGTSTFRLRLVQKSSAEVMEEQVAAVGTKALYLKWQQENGDREWMFLHFLKDQISQLHAIVPDDIEIVISGMASSNIGIRELKYAQLPFSIFGSGLNIERIIHPLFPNGIFLVSGVCSDSDVIRGEETQIVGLAQPEDLNGKCIFILPGTHSKHILCEHGKITALNTFMTGELFEVIRAHTILKTSVQKPTVNFNDLTAFEDGIRQSRKGSILNSLFKIRARDILDKKSPQENYYYLSGLLIGEEISTLKPKDYDQIKLCAGNNLHTFYERAISVLELSEKTIIIDKKTVENSVIKGQLRILNQYKML